MIKNALRVLTFDNLNRELEGADVLTLGPVIKAVGKDIQPPPGARVLDAKGCVVTPGLVNTHHHLFQTLTRNVPAAQDAKLFDWLTRLYDIWKHLTPEAVSVSAQVGFSELLLTGCTTTTDHLYVFPKGAPAEWIDLEIEAAGKIGIRFQPTRGSMSLGRSRGGLPPDELVQGEEEILKDSERLVKKYHDPSPLSMCRVALAPCSPFSVTTELLKLTAEAASKWKVSLHTHLAETLDEIEFCRQRHGMTPLEYMDSAGWLGPRTWLAHCVHMGPVDIRRMAQTRTAVAHCPTSNLRLGSGIAPVRDFLNAGVRVGLGVDGSASNDSSDMLGEARQCLLVHRVKSGVGSMPARDALRIATRGGADALGFEAVGSLETDKAADIAVFDLNGVDFAGAWHDPVAALLFAGASRRARWVMVNGRLVVEDFALAGLDEEELAARANRLAFALVEKAADGVK